MKKRDVFVIYQEDLDKTQRDLDDAVVKGADVARKNGVNLSKFKNLISPRIENKNDEDQWTFDYESYLCSMANGIFGSPLEWGSDFYRGRWIDNKTMKAKEFRQEQDYPYNHFTKLTSTGISPDYDHIEAFAEAYHQSKVENLTIPDSSAYLCKNINGEDAIVFADNIAGVFDKLDDITPNPETVIVAGKSMPHYR